ncbi:MAG: NAD(P)H-dependent oxidoreductase subunit E [Planctomycetaceae bacterium]|nr:NAD(P)H-dependent oxidoreductase subunit E [Planctomycetaceae bacterium]
MPPVATDNTSHTSRKFTQVCDILEKNEYNPARLIPILQQVQEFYRYLPEDVLAFVATSLDLPPAHVYGVATFYAHFTLIPKGKYNVRLCDGTACHVKGSEHILHALYDRLKLSPAKQTSDDMLFTVETVSCLGACGLAPVMVVDEKVYSKMTPENAVGIIEEIISQEQQ